MRSGQRLTRRSATQALDRTASSGIERLDQLLTSATAPPTTFELNREADTVALFKATRTLAPATAPRPALPRLTRTRFAVPAAVGLVMTTGGLAFAVSAGYIPAPLGLGPSSPTSTPPHTVVDAPGGGSTHGPKHHGQHGQTGAPSRTLTTLCHAYQANGATGLRTRRFSALVKAAGGTSHVATFCIDLLAKPSTGPTGGPTTPSPSPSDPSPSSGPTGSQTGSSDNNNDGNGNSHTGHGSTGSHKNQASTTS